MIDFLSNSLHARPIRPIRSRRNYFSVYHFFPPEFGWHFRVCSPLSLCSRLFPRVNPLILALQWVYKFFWGCFSASSVCRVALYSEKFCFDMVQFLFLLISITHRVPSLFQRLYCFWHSFLHSVFPRSLFIFLPQIPHSHVFPSSGELVGDVQLFLQPGVGPD